MAGIRTPDLPQKTIFDELLANTDSGSGMETVRVLKDDVIAQIKATMAYISTAVTVIDKDLATPPASPAVSDTYIVGPSATGAWVGKEKQIAAWNGTAWTFSNPATAIDRFVVLVLDEFELYAWGGSDWATLTSAPLARATLAQLAAITGAPAYVEAHVLSDVVGGTISTISRTSNVATVATALAHGLSSGDKVNVRSKIAGFSATQVAVTVTDSTHFTYSNNGSNVGATADGGTLDRNGVYSSDGAGAWIWVGDVDVALLLSQVDAAVQAANAAAASLAIVQSTAGWVNKAVELGSSNAPIAGLTLASNTYLFARQVPADGSISTIAFFARTSGTLKIKRFNSAGAEVANASVAIASSGLKALTSADFGAFAIQKGDFIGIYTDCGYSTTSTNDPKSVYFNAGAGDLASNASWSIISNNRLEIKITLTSTVTNTDFELDRVKAQAAAEASLQDVQILGYPTTPIPDGTATLGAARNIYYDRAKYAGRVSSVSAYATAASTVELTVWSRSGDVWTIKDRHYFAAVIGSNTWTPDYPITFNEGDYVSIYGTALRYSLPGHAPGYGTMSAGVANTTFTPTVVNTTFQIHAQIVLKYDNARSSNTEHVVDVKNSDKIAVLGNSFTSGSYNLMGKAWHAKVSQLTDWRLEDFAVSGWTIALQLQDLRAGQYYYYSNFADGGWLNAAQGGLTYADYRASHGMVVLVTNSPNLQAWLDGLHDVVEQMKGLGLVPIVASEHWAPPVAGNALTSALKMVGDERGAHVFDTLATAATFYLGAASSYFGFERGGHPGQRKSDLFTCPMVRNIKEQLGKPRQNVKIYRRRASWTVGAIHDLMFDVSDNEKFGLGQRWQEIYCGSRDGLTPGASEAYVDRIDLFGTGAPGTYTLGPPVLSEYLHLQAGHPLGFTDYALLVFTINGTAPNVNSATLEIGDPTLQVYVRDTLVSPYPAAGGIAGNWRQLTVAADGTVSLRGTELIGKLAVDQLVFMVANGGSAFTLQNPRLRWRGKEGKPAESRPTTRKPRGATLLGTPYVVASDALASGWSSTGSPTFGRGVARTTAMTALELPQGATGHVELSSLTSDTISYALTFAADPLNAREAEIRVWAHAVRALVDPATYPTGASITPDTWDFEQIKVEAIFGTIAAPQKKTVGLYWWDVRVPITIPAGVTSMTVRISCASGGAIGVAYAQVQLMD